MNEMLEHEMFSLYTIPLSSLEAWLPSRILD